MGINNDFSMRAASTSVTAPPTNVTGYTISPSNDAMLKAGKSEALKYAQSQYPSLKEENLSLISTDSSLLKFDVFLIVKGKILENLGTINRRSRDQNGKLFTPAPMRGSQQEKDSLDLNQTSQTSEDFINSFSAKGVISRKEMPNFLKQIGLTESQGNGQESSGWKWDIESIKSSKQWLDEGRTSPLEETYVPITSESKKQKALSIEGRESKTPIPEERNIQNSNT